MANDVSRKFHLAPDIFTFFFYNLILPTVSRYVTSLPPALQNISLSDIRAAQTSIQGGHVSYEKTAKKYSDWMSFCTKMQIDHMVEDPEDPVINILQVFGHRVRHGHYSSWVSSVRADTVDSARRAIAKTHLLEGLWDPRKPLGSHS